MGRLNGGRSISLTADVSNGEDAVEYGELTKSMSIVLGWNWRSMVRDKAGDRRWWEEEEGYGWCMCLLIYGRGPGQNIMCMCVTKCVNGVKKTTVCGERRGLRRRQVLKTA